MGILTGIYPNITSSAIVKAKDDLLYTADGQKLIDLFTGHGTVWLGHCREEIKCAIQKQLDEVWITGGYHNPSIDAMCIAINDFLPAGYALGSLASTGMEANEQALRIARVSTGRNKVVGLSGAMHGKSFFTAALAWNNGDGLSIPHICRVSAGPSHKEADTLREIEDCLRARDVAALFIEPIHGTSHGWHATRTFYQQVRSLTAQYGTQLIYDEVLTGFYRTGKKFRFLDHQIDPDVLVFGKACGNGFPVGGVAIRKGIQLTQKMLLGSTYAGNPLAATAVTSSLACLATLNVAQKVSEIEQTVIDQFGWIKDRTDMQLHGAGAIWVITLDSPSQTFEAVKSLRNVGVCVGFHGTQIRLLPPATITQAHLLSACELIKDTLVRQCPADQSYLQLW